MRFTWKKNYEAYQCAPQGVDLNCDGQCVGYVRHARGGWYWYGADYNSLWNNVTYATIEEAKEACKAHVKKVMEEKVRLK